MSNVPLSDKLAKIDEILRMYSSGQVFDTLVSEKNEILQQLQEKKHESKSNESKPIIVNNNLEKTNVYSEFINGVVHNFLIHAPTQVGKTDATRELIQVCCEKNVPVVVSCDNKTDQLTQMYTRLSNDLEYDNDVILVKASESHFGHTVENAFKENRKLIVFCLDNGSQLKKVKNQFALQILLEKTKIQKLLLISDEGDVVTKDYNIEEIEDEQCQSHKEWIRMTNLFTESGVDIKRVFVTATPENVVYKYNIEQILRLDVPSSYIGYENIKYIEMEPKEIKDVLIEEQNRRICNGDNGIILYCMDKKIQSGQDPTFVAVCSYLKKSIVNTYNGNGIIARVLNKKKFETHLKRFVSLYNKSETIKKINFFDASTCATKNVFHIRNMAICDFYQICKDSGNRVVVTIGMDLVARGISFVSSEKTKNALAATTMIYRPGTKLHAVALCQTIGRITGTARPDLERRLYAPQDVIDTYKKYNENQKQYLNQLAYSNGKMTSEIMEKMTLNHKLSRPLDRAKLKLKPLYTEEPQTPVSEPDRMKQLIDLWWTSDTIIGKVLRFVRDSDIGVTELELKCFLQEIGSVNVDELFNELARNKRGHFLVFERTENKITKLRKEATQYITTK